MLNRIEAAVTMKGLTYKRLDGSTDRADRQKMVDDFNQKPSISLFLISTLAGGVGLNLQSANKCDPRVTRINAATNPLNPSGCLYAN